MAQEQRTKLETIEDELEDVKRKLGRIWHFIETADNVEMTDASDRIREHRDRQGRLEDLAAEARAILSQRRADLDDVETIAAYAQDMSEFLKESELTERRAFIETFVKEIVVMSGDALLRYTIPISQSTRKAQVLVGGGFEEFRVGDAADASRQLAKRTERLYARAVSCCHLLKQGQFRQVTLAQPIPHGRRHQVALVSLPAQKVVSPHFPDQPRGSVVIR